jgi:hypothetical protein
MTIHSAIKGFPGVGTELLGLAGCVWVGSRGFVLASGAPRPGPRQGLCGQPLDPATKGVAPGPHWCAARPRPPAPERFAPRACVARPHETGFVAHQPDSAALRRTDELVI